MFKIKEDSKNKKVFLHFDNLGNKVLKGMRQGLYRVGKNALVPTVSQGILQSRKSGRYYKYAGRKYRASAAGEYPANVTGKNRRSIDFFVKGKETLYFGAGEEYSKYLVEGTKNMAKRDFLQKAIRQTRQKTKRLLITEIDRAIKK